MKKQLLQFKQKANEQLIPPAENEQGGAGNAETSGANDEAALAQGGELTGLKGVEANLAQGPVPQRTGFETADSLGK